MIFCKFTVDFDRFVDELRLRVNTLYSFDVQFILIVSGIDIDIDIDVNLNSSYARCNTCRSI